MKTIDKVYEVNQTINKSVFVCQLFPINNEQDAKKILQEQRKKYYDSTHNCYAYIYGDKGEYMKFSDDGEPSQTAGIVIYEVLRKNDLTNIIAIITRYFGGIKLGAGGLVRAYSSSTALVLKEAYIFDIVKTIDFSLEFSYANYNNVSKLLSNFEAIEITKSFQEQVKIECSINEEKFIQLKENLIDITKNQIHIKIIN